MSLARLILNKSALCGLRVSVWDDDHGGYQDGLIEQFDTDHNCYIVVGSTERFAVQFHQFTVEEDGQQLVLKVFNCTRVQLPDSYSPVLLEDDISLSATSSRRVSTAAASRRQSVGDQQPYTGPEQASSSGGTPAAADQGFGTGTETLLQQLSSQSSDISDIVGASFSNTAAGYEAVVADRRSSSGSGVAGSPQQQVPGANSRGNSAPGSRYHSADGAPASGQASRSGSSSMAVQGAATPAAPAAAAYAFIAAAAGAGGAVGGEGSRELEAGELAEVEDDSDAVSAEGYWGSPLKQGGTRADAPGTRHTGETSGSFSEQGSPQLNKKTPAAPSPTPGNINTAGGWVSSPGLTTFKEISRKISAGRITDPGAGGTALDPSGHSWEQLEGAGGLAMEDSSLALAAALDEAGVLTGPADVAEGGGAGDDMNFTISSVPDVSTRPSSGRLSRRSSRALAAQDLMPLSTNEGMMVDIPQPLSQRARSSSRQPSWDASAGPLGSSTSPLLLPADNFRRVSSSGVAATAAAGGGTGLVRGEASAGSGSLLVASRRISRATSTRVTADQDWVVGAVGSMELGAGAVPLHVLGGLSRRSSRTLSGRLPPDQDAAVIPEVLGAGEQDVLPRPVTATDFVSSRRQSAHSNNARSGTPDSDGFGFSAFEGVEPLVSPAAAAAQAAAAEAAVAAGVHAAAAAAVQSAAGQLRRRSSRSIPHVPGLDPSTGASQPPDVAVGLSSSYVGSHPSGTLSRVQSAAGAQLERLPESPPSKLSSRRASGAGTIPGSASLSRQASRGVAHIKAAAVAAASALESFLGNVLAGPGAAAAAEYEQVGRYDEVVEGLPRPAAPFSPGSGDSGSGSSSPATPPAARFGSYSAAAHHQQQQQQEVEEVEEVEEEEEERLSRPSYADSFVTSERAAATGNPFAEGQEGDSLQGGAGLFSSSSLLGTPASAKSGDSRTMSRAAAAAAAAAGTTAAWHAMERGGGVLPPGTQGSWGSGVSVAKGSAYSSLPCRADSPESVEAATPEVRGAASLMRSGLSRSSGGSGGGSRLGKETSQQLDSRQQQQQQEVKVVGGGDKEQEEEGGAPGEDLPLNLPYTSSMRRVGPASTHEITPVEEEDPTRAAAAVRSSSSSSSSIAAGASVQREASTRPSGPSGPTAAAAAGVAVVPAALAAAAAAAAGHAKRSSLEGLPPPPSYAESLADEASSITYSRSPSPLNPTYISAAGGNATTNIRHTAQLEGTIQMQSLHGGQGWAAAGGRSSSRLGAEGEVLMLGMPAYGYEESDTMPLVMHGGKGVMGYGMGGVPRTPAESRTLIGRTILHCWLAASAQWYCDLVFMCLGTQLIAAYLPPGWAADMRLVALAALYWAGHVLQPVGLAIWPALTGSKGRRHATWAQALLGGFATAFIGCMPNHSQGGLVGLVLVLALRLAHGLTLGVDTPGHLAYLADHATASPSLHTSLPAAAAAAGALGASAACLFFSWVLEGGALAFWGWRLPLVFGLLVQVGSALLRTSVLSCPEDSLSISEVEDRRLANTGRILRCHLPEVLLAVLAGAFGSISFTLSTAFLPAYFINITSLSTPIALTTHTINLGLLLGLIPLGGFLVDGSTTHSRLPFVLVACGVAAALAYPIWMLLAQGVAGVAWFGEFVLLAPGGLALGASAGVITEAFPRGVRTSAMSLVLCLTSLCLAAGGPLMAVGLVVATGNPASPAAVTVLSAAVSVLATWLLKRRAVE